MMTYMTHRETEKDIHGNDVFSKQIKQKKNSNFFVGCYLG